MVRRPTDAWDRFKQQKTIGNLSLWLASGLGRAAIVAALFLLIQVPPVAMAILRKQNHFGISSIVTIVAFILIFGAIIWWARRIYHRYDRTPRKEIRPVKSIWYMFLGYIAIYVGQIVLGMLNLLIYHQSQTANNNEVAKMMANNTVVMIVFGLSTVLLTPIAEELIFRGVLTNLFFKPNQFWPKLILSGVVFSMGHMSTNLISFLIYFYMGMVLAFLYQKTGNIRLSIGLHGFNNLIAVSQMIILLTR